MIDGVFEWGSNLMAATPLLAFVGAFVWGILSVILSPCHLTSIPLIVGFVSQQRADSVKRAFWISAAFAFGILLTIALIGVITSLMGLMMGDVGVWSNYLVAGVFLLVGLHLIGVIPIQFPGMGQLNYSRKGVWAAFFLGLLFGIALGPCTFAFMAPVLMVTLFSPDSGFWHNVLLLAAYGVGHCLVIVLAGSFTQVIQKYLDWNERSKGVKVIKAICGVLIIIGGVYLIVQR